ncbi:DNA-directed DNA polymerase [Saliniradius amylolyticus]|uniref:DNA polymerase III subunit delta n=1 Tax=Saliniradius amylolyticus TaxID=2183582 RepID=A0A2S2E1Q3_9ALTE|nr:DNA polymerase III subunit delta [Saliniradius amylolyticus]AWL11452.1 DNA-directed DNA polymerase [Saliniradius amylolyticus]
MQVYPNRFDSTVAQQGLACFYLIFGDEPQQKLEVIDAIRQHAKQHGFDERQSFQADNQFQWATLVEATQTLSLFSARQLIELELPSGKPGAEGSKVLKQLAETPSEDVIVVLHGNRIGKDVQNTKWFKALDNRGVYVPCYPMEGNHLQNWVRQRLQQHQLQAEPEVVKLIADYCEGNLLAARQEIEKLALLFPGQSITLEQATGAVVDQSRFNVFQLVDVLLAGDAARSVKLLQRLESEGIEPTIILWALVREWQTLYELQFALNQGNNLSALFKQHRIWRNRQGLYQTALQRLDLPTLDKMHGKLMAFDQALKQSSITRPYVELCHLCLLFMPMPLDALELGY